MIKKIRLENKSGKNLEICVEPTVEYMDWEVNKFVEIEIAPLEEKYNDTVDIVLTTTHLIIYDAGPYDLRISIDNELRYSSLY